MSEAEHLDPGGWLPHVPVTLFTIVMGLCGFMLALRAGEAALGLGHLISSAAHLLSMVIFAAVSVLYVTKGLRHPGAVAAEWQHPVKLAFFPAISIALVLMSVVMFDQAPVLARGDVACGGAPATCSDDLGCQWLDQRAVVSARASDARLVQSGGGQCDRGDCRRALGLY